MRAIPANAIAMRVSFCPREWSCAAPWGNLCRHHLRKSSTVRGSSASTIEAPPPGFRCNCGGDLRSRGSIDSLPVPPRSGVFGAHCESRDDDLLMRGSLEGARKRRANSSTLMCGAGPNAGTLIWSSFEREHELATPPARVTLRQCSSRRGKQSLRQWRRRTGLLGRLRTGRSEGHSRRREDRCVHDLSALSAGIAAQRAGHVILNSALDRPWSQYFYCMLIGPTPILPPRSRPSASCGP